MGMFDWAGDAAEWVGDRVTEVEQWFGDLFSGDLGTQAMPMPEVVEKVRASHGATDSARAKLKPLGEVADTAARTFSANSTFANLLTSA